MAHYMFPTSSTEGENYFVQFDIYKLKFPIKKPTDGRRGARGHAEALAIHSDPAAVGYSAYVTSTRPVVAADPEKDDNKEPVGFLDSMKNLYGAVTIDLNAIKDTIKDWQNTYDYEQQANELLHSIKLPLQMAPSENTAGNYNDEATRDFQTIAKLLGGKGVTAEEAQGLIQDETLKSIGKHVNRMQGTVLNQSPEMFYGGPKKREYAFNFSLIARNFKDSTELSKIIRRFHYHASPGASDDAIFWSYPQMVRFFFVDKSGELIKLFSHSNSEFTHSARVGGTPKNTTDVETKYASKACFIDNVTAEYGVMGDQLRFLDEQNSQTGVANVKLTVSLKEAEYFTKKDYGIDDAN